MVGIGGGVPSKVRLGDVVVSAPVAEYPGVVQWCLGKSAGGHFKRNKISEQPSDRGSQEGRVKRYSAVSVLILEAWIVR